jgi:hypothetical protein
LEKILEILKYLQLYTLQGRRGPDGLSSSFGEVIVVTFGPVIFGPMTFGPVTSGPVTSELVTFGPVTSVLASLTASPPIARSGLYRTERLLRTDCQKREAVVNVSKALGIY